jgi:hypothetical protein
MTRKNRLLLITHAYPLFAAAELEFGYHLLGNMFDELLFNLMPGFFVILVVYEWLRSGPVSLIYPEKRSLWYFIISIATFHLYYCICTIMNATDNRPWVQEHNDFLTYFVVFTFIFYIIIYCCEHK